VGTGSSQHVAELGALALTDAGLDARWSGSMAFARSGPKPDRDDAVIVISHTARSSFALAAREAAFASGALVASITGIGAGWQEAIETVTTEKSQTYTVSVTAALMVLLRLAGELPLPGCHRPISKQPLSGSAPSSSRPRSRRSTRRSVRSCW
jgi:glucosamine--fructose-6-phosphate aminotransferase (isomerizing)